MPITIFISFVDQDIMLQPSHEPLGLSIFEHDHSCG
jgi:hypothetical protein